MIYPQQWCGQTQPHHPHVWADSSPTSSSMYLSCAGCSGKAGEQS